MISLTVLEFITLCFVGCGVLAGIIIAFLLILEKTDNLKAKLSLSLLLFLSSLTIIGLMIDFLGFANLNRNLYFLPLRYTFWIAPLVYFYVRFSLFPSRKLFLWDALHFVLPLAQASFYLWVGFRGVAYKTRVWLSIIRPYGEWEDIVFNIGLPFYMLLAFLLIRQFQKSNPDNQQIFWLRRFLLILLLVVVVNLFYELVNYSFMLGFPPAWCCPSWFFVPQMLAFSLLLFWLAFNGYLHIRFMRLSNAKPQTSKPARKETYNLEETLIHELGDKLELLMQEEKPFLNPDLNLASLASELTISAKALSMVINETKGKSYNDYVNHYRIDFVKARLADPSSQDVSLLDIAFDAGFNSKATFNRVFKHVTGLTPSQYRKQAQ